MKIQEFNRGYGVEVKVVGKDYDIMAVERALLFRGYEVGSTISDFRMSSLITDAPLNIVKVLAK